MNDRTSLTRLFTETLAIVSGQPGQDFHVPVGFLDDLYKCTTKAELLGVYAVWGRQISQSDRCSVALDNGDNTVVKHALDGDFDFGKGIRHDIADTAVGEVVREAKLLYLPDLSQINLPDTQSVSSMGYASSILAPVVNDARCFGTLAASYRVRPENPGMLLALSQAISRCLATQLLVIEQMQNLSQMARTDALTGAGNRYDLYEQAETAWTTWQDEARLFSFMSMDVDHFKQINDTYGHDAGDAVLCAFVRRLRCRSRTSDRIIRTGGEEFGMLMYDTDLGAAVERAQRLCDVIGNSPFAVGGMELMITASFGVTQVMQGDEAFQDVMKRADMALYEAKGAGRDQVISITDADLAA